MLKLWCIVVSGYVFWGEGMSDIALGPADWAIRRVPPSNMYGSDLQSSMPSLSEETPSATDRQPDFLSFFLSFFLSAMQI